MTPSLISKFHHRFLLFTKAITSKGTDETPRPRYVNLTPVDNADENGAYTHAILTALHDPGVLNIAITGPYGSGKSSVLKTFSNNHKREFKTPVDS